MKRILAAILLLVAFGVAYWWFARTAPRTSPVPTSAPPVDSRRAEREARFGSEALAPDVRWRESGLGYRIIREGTPPQPGLGARVELIYTGRLKNGTVFDRSEKPREFLIGGTIPGLSSGLQMLGTGGKAVLFIPPALGYGHSQVFGIPPDSGLIFDVEVAAINP